MSATPKAQAANPAPAGGRVTLAEVLARTRQMLESGDLAGAEQLAKTVLTQRPKHVEATQVLAAIAERRGDGARAVELLRSALNGGVTDSLVNMNLCRVLRQLGRLEEARAAGEASIALGTHPEALVDLADVQVLLGDNDAALELFERAVVKAPGLARAHLGLAHALLMKGEFRAGWAEYEWRYRLPNTQKLLPKFKQPQWNGMPLRASRLFVLCEQGYGDCFQFARYLPLVAERVPDLIVGVSAELKPIISSIKGPRVFYDRWENLPPFDFQITLSSLPYAFGTTPADIPAQVPYLTADPARVAHWRARLDAQAKGRPAVGLVWHGRPQNHHNATRSIPLTALSPVLERDDVCLVSLQVGAGSEELAQHPLKERVLDAGPELKDFGETAALMTALDHMVTIETAAAHLAGALGRPGSIMLPHVADWRWLEKRADSPWYPTLELIRQEKPGDWAGVAARVAAKLHTVRRR